MTNFKRILLVKGVKEVDLAKQTGITLQTISLFALGKVDISSRRLYKIAKTLNVCMEELMEEE